MKNKYEVLSMGGRQASQGGRVGKMEREFAQANMGGGGDFLCAVVRK